MILPHPRLVMTVEKKKGEEKEGGKDGGGGGGEKTKAKAGIGLQIPPGLEDNNIGFAQATEKKETKTEGKKDMSLKEKETEKMDELLKQI